MVRVHKNWYIVHEMYQFVLLFVYARNSYKPVLWCVCFKNVPLYRQKIAKIILKKYFYVTSSILYSGIYQYIFIEKVYIFCVHCVQIALSLVRVRTQRVPKWYILCTLCVHCTNFVYILVYLTNTVSLIYDIIEAKEGMWWKKHWLLFYQLY